MACGATPTIATPAYPETGLLLLSIKDGTPRASAPIGSDVVAVIVSGDGKTAYLADSAPGDVYSVALPDLEVAWKHHVGGAPFGLLLHGGRLFVSLFSGARVVELDPTSGAQLATHTVHDGPAVLAVGPDGRVMVAGTRGHVDYLDGTSTPAGNGFAVAVVNGAIWTADYERAELVPVGGDHRVGLPLPVFPFWLAPGAGDALLVAAEGGTEDTDPGGVFSFDTMTGAFTTLGTPKDPDQVLQSGSTIFVAAHGDRDVLAIDAGRTRTWARGAAAVALAADPPLGYLVVAVNTHE
ncbi:MAG: YncE family protein [Candidatus Dormibacteraceae bacterium]